MSVILRLLEQTLNLHILSGGVTFRAEQMKRFNLTTTCLDGLINWIMKEEAQNCWNWPIVVQTDARVA